MKEVKMRLGKIAWAGILIVAAGSGRAWAVAAPLSAQVEKFGSEFLPWEPDSHVTAKPDPANDLKGLHAFAVERKGKYEKLNLKTGFYVSADETGSSREAP